VVNWYMKAMMLPFPWKMIAYLLSTFAIAAAKEVTFYAVGDVPYTDMEACLLPFELEKLSPLDGKFLIHLGDIRGGKPDLVTGLPTDCPEQLFQHVSGIFESSRVTTFFIPGDNGWLDCFDATEAYGYWEKHLFNFNERTDLGWPSFPATVNRWASFPPGVDRSSRRSEFFSFLLDNVLFIGLSLPDVGRNKDNEWHPRDGLTKDNIEWTRDNFEEHARVMKAVVLFGHDATTSQNDDFFEGLIDLATEKNYIKLPILVLEDGHSFSSESGFLTLPNVLRLAQDDTVTPMKITVDTSAKGLSNIFKVDRRCVCSSDHRPTQLMKYDDSHECADACTEASNACQGEDRCRPDKPYVNGC